MSDHSFIILTGLFVCALCLGYIVWYFEIAMVRRPAKTGLALALAPAAVFMLLIVTLALHMWLTLGKWPLIGNEGFPWPLMMHSDIAYLTFYGQFLVTLFLLPVVAFLCTLFDRWREIVPYLALYYIGFCGEWATITVLPGGFQNWWWG